MQRKGIPFNEKNALNPPDEGAYLLLIYPIALATVYNLPKKCTLKDS